MSPTHHPPLSVELAQRWLNIDTYWDVLVDDPCDERGGKLELPRAAVLPGTARYPVSLLQQFPIEQRAGSVEPLRSQLYDPHSNHLAQSSLLMTLVRQLRAQVLAQDWENVREKIAQLETVSGLLHKSLSATQIQAVFAETHLECGLAYRQMGEQGVALEWVLKSGDEFGFANPHAAALAHWIAGYLQLEMSARTFNAGLAHWQIGWQAFADLAQNTSNLRIARWYETRAQLMLNNLLSVTERGSLTVKAKSAPRPVATASIVTPAPEPIISPVMPTARDVPPSPARPKAPAKPAWLVLPDLPIYDSIGADPAGLFPSGRVEHVQIAHLYIASRRYRLLELKNQRKTFYQGQLLLNLASSGYALIRVEGDSMKDTEPPIEENDYVLVREVADPPKHSIVAAVLENEAITLKYRELDGLHSANDRYRPIPITRVKQYIGEAVAVLKLDEE